MKMGNARAMVVPVFTAHPKNDNTICQDFLVSLLLICVTLVAGIHQES
jgi:hypothetical protein